MKKLAYLLLLLIVASCQEEENILGPAADMNLNLHAVYNGTPLIMQQPYNYPDGQRVKFDQFNFFIANVTLLEAETGDELDLLEVALVDFSDNISSSSVHPVTHTIKSVPAVKYKGIRLSIGVPSNLNKSSILSYGAGHPVRAAYDTHFWKDGSSFFFMKLDGTYDLNQDGVFGNLPGDHPFQFYPAKNPNYTTITVLRNFTIEDGKTFDLNLVIDVLKLLRNGINYIDLTKMTNLSTYDPENAALSTTLMKNFTEAVSIE
jgi:hypothetical protein